MRYFIKRSVAYFIDCFVCYALIMLIIQWLILSHVRKFIGLSNEWFKDPVNLELYVLLTISLPVWIYFIYFDSKKANGTLGKKIMKLSVRSIDNKKIGIGKSFLRTLMKLLPWEIAHVGVVFPTPMYFEYEPGIRVLTIAGMVLLTIYAISILFRAHRQTVYDKFLKTIVIEK